MSVYSQYAGGIKDSVNNTYNLLVTGGTDYPQSAGIIFGNSTLTGASTRIYQDVSSNAYVDFQATASNSLAFRYTSNGSTFSNMLTLMNDDKSSAIHAVNTNGRMAASQFVSTGDSRAPSQAGLYVYQNNGAQFGMAGGGFNFSNYNSNGTINNTALVLNSNGSVLTPYYNQTVNAADNETSAMATFDTNGNMARNWNMNYRLRKTENDSMAIYDILNGGLPVTVNNIITRLNGLNMYSSNLPLVATISSFSNVTVTPTPTPTPVSVVPNSASATSASWTSNGVTWNASASAIANSTYPAYSAFNNLNASASYGSWAGSSNYTNNGAYNGTSSSTTITGLGTKYGDWLQIQSSVPLVMVSYRFGVGNKTTMPYSYYIVGSNDGTTWYPLQQTTFITNPFTSASNANAPWSNQCIINYTGTQTIVGTQSGSCDTMSYATSTNKYTYFRLSTQNLWPAPDGTTVEVEEWFILFTM